MFEQSAGRNALLKESAYEIKATPDAGIAPRMAEHALCPT